VNGTNNRESSALRLAAVLGHVEVAGFLVELGASAEGIKVEDVGTRIPAGDSVSGSRVNAIRELLGMRPLGSELSTSASTKSGLGFRRYTSP
jgi:hypothetical protein